jgi:hypothetical protein
VTRFLLFACAVLAAGCGGDVPRSTVTGTVKFRGQPLREASVVFLASDNSTHALILDEAGRYKVDGVARGKVRVVVQAEPESAASSRPERPVMRAGGGEAAKDAARRQAEPPAPALKAGPPIPAKYANPDTSGLSFDLTEANQTYDIDL